MTGVKGTLVQQLRSWPQDAEGIFQRGKMGHVDGFEGTEVDEEVFLVEEKS